MSEQHRLPIVTESDLLIMLTEEAVRSENDPHFKGWFAEFLGYNPLLGGEILHLANEGTDGDPDSFNKIIRVVSYTLHALEIAANRDSTPID